MKTIIKALETFLSQKVEEATNNVLNKIVRKVEYQQKEISELKEENRMLRAAINQSKGISKPIKKVRMSSYDIRNFRRKIGVTQEVFAFMLEVNRETVTRWEKGHSQPAPRQRKSFIRLKSMSKDELSDKIQTAFTALYN